MKKGTIKFLITFVILAAVAVTVFFIGWVQFAVPPGKYGVMISKSCGYNSKVIAPNEFMWRWERLIPTNSEILIFDLTPQILERNFSDFLHNAEKYKKASSEKKDFAWSINIKLKVKMKSNMLTEIVKENELKTQEQFIRHIEQITEKNIKTVINTCIEFYKNAPEKYTHVDFQNKYLQEFTSTFEGFETEIISFSFADPDFQEYAEAKRIYEEYKNMEEKILAFKIEKLRKLQSALSDLSVDINSSLNTILEIIKE